jgi:hypothetical protein
MTVRRSTRTTIATSLALGLLGSGLMLAPAASAHSGGGGGGGVRANGACAAHGSWKLKAKPDDSRLEVEAEVDVNRAGQHWTWTIKRNGNVVRSGSATTKAPSGSFSVNRGLANSAGTDRITFQAVNSAESNSCHGSVTA